MPSPTLEVSSGLRARKPARAAREMMGQGYGGHEQYRAGGLERAKSGQQELKRAAASSMWPSDFLHPVHLSSKHPEYERGPLTTPMLIVHPQQHRKKPPMTVLDNVTMRIILAACTALLLGGYSLGCGSASNACLYLRSGMTISPAIQCSGANSFGDQECHVGGKVAAFTITVSLSSSLTAQSY